MSFRVPPALAGRTVSLTAPLAAGPGPSDAAPTNDVVAAALVVA